MLFPLGLEEFDIAFTAPAHGVVVAHHQMFNADGLEQDLFDKGCGRRGCKLFTEGNNDQHVDAGHLDQALPSAVRWRST